MSEIKGGTKTGEGLKMEDVNEQMEVRRKKLLQLKDSGVALYPNDFRPKHVSSQILSEFNAVSDDHLLTLPKDFSMAGRIMGIRSFGKASFFHLQDRGGRLQVYVRQDRLGKEGYDLFK
ncbi:MAG: OB-fold nucleic acid binding domain-containing protein, partial [Candidatus Binatia bacterium]